MHEKYAVIGTYHSVPIKLVPLVRENDFGDTNSGGS